MQAIILAAGKSTRTYPLTLTRPKPLLKVAGKTILEHNLDAILEIKEIDETIIVVGYKKEMIENYLGINYKKLKIRYVEQKEQLGTGHALLTASKHINGRFILLMGDNIYCHKDIFECVKHSNSILMATVSDPENYGVIAEKDGFVYDIIEKPKKFISNKISTALYVFEKNFLQYLDKIKKTNRNEVELPDAVKMFSEDNRIKCMQSTLWLPIGNPSDLLEADKKLRNGKNIVGQKTKINGKVENCSVGDNCLIDGNAMDSIIMSNTIIKKNSEIINSIIGENATFSGKAENAVIGDSVIAENANINSCRIWNNKKILNRSVASDVAD